MKTAIDCYERGKQIEANAEEYDRSLYYSRGRFICPECGEPVFLTGGKYNNHFAHHKKGVASIDCDRRVDGASTKTVYERIGMPLYIRRNETGNFGLYMGFKALPKPLMEQAINDSIMVRVGKSRFKINEERFSCDSTTLVPIDFVPDYGMEYVVSYEPSYKSYKIAQYWAEYADGFLLEGALFSASELGGKKIRRGDSVVTDMEYFWVRRCRELPSGIPGIQMECFSRLVLNGKSYNVFRGIFSSDISEGEYETLAYYLRSKLKVFLLEKKPEFVPLWPPAIKTEEGYKIDENNQYEYGYIQSGNDLPKVYAYRGILKIPDELYVDENLSKVRLDSRYTYINVDRKYVSNGVLFVKDKNNENAFDANIYIAIDGDISIINNAFIRVGMEKMLLSSAVPTESVVIHDYGMMDRYIVNGECEINGLKSNDIILIWRNWSVLACISVDIDYEAGYNFWKDKDLIESVRKLSTSKRVKIPYKIRLRMTELKGEVDVMNGMIDSMLDANLMPLPLVKKLEDMFDDNRA